MLQRTRRPGPGLTFDRLQLTDKGKVLTCRYATL